MARIEAVVEPQVQEELGYYGVAMAMEKYSANGTTSLWQQWIVLNDLASASYCGLLWAQKSGCLVQLKHDSALHIGKC